MFRLVGHTGREFIQVGNFRLTSQILKSFRSCRHVFFHCRNIDLQYCPKLNQCFDNKMFDFLGLSKSRNFGPTLHEQVVILDASSNALGSWGCDVFGQ